jgi:alkylation response protein AidB-like acyl-CoA dehydrogenase
VNFEHTEEQRLLAESVRRFLAREYGFDSRRRILASPEGMSPGAWREMAEMGLLGLGLPAEYGGFGGGALDLMGVMEAFGEALVLEPFLSTVVGAQFIARAGTRTQREQLLAPVAQGALKLAFAHTERDSRYDIGRVATRAQRDGAGYVVSGEKLAVIDGPHAEKFVVTARADEGLVALLVDARGAGVRQVPSRMLDGHRGCDVAFEAVRVGPHAVVGDAKVLDEVVDFATALVCAEAVGAMRYANEATLEYLKTRKQFGVPIGAFQALQHRMVDMVIECEQSRSMASLACARVDANLPPHERKRAVSLAKIKVADACRLVSQESVQLHGGMGMTEELKVSHAFRRLTVMAQQFGDADYHLERVASLPA